MPADPSTLPIGIFAKTFPGSTPDVVLGAAARAGFRHVQFNLSSAGLETVPEIVPLQTENDIAHSIQQYQISIDALSGTTNICHPDRGTRQESIRRLVALAATCRRLGIPVLTLSTGTRDPADLWCAHPDNQSAAALSDLRGSLRHLLDATASTGVTLAFEPEASNVIQTADQAADLITEFSDARLAVVLDLATLLGDAGVTGQGEIIHHAARRLRGHIALAHAKDIDAHHAVVAPGMGAIDFTRYLSALRRDAGYTGPVIMHGLSAGDVPAALRHLRAARDAAQLSPSS